MKARRRARSLLLSELEQVRVLADPLRLRIVEALMHEPATAKQVAAAIGEKPSRIYHHVELLERAGLLQLVETRRKRGTTERYLAPVAKAFVVDRELFAPARGAAASEAADLVQDAVVDLLLDSAEQLRRGIRDGIVPLQDPSRCELARIPLRLSPTEVPLFMKKVRALLDEAIAAPDASDGTSYHMLVGLYPIP
jgi:DNA-binding transcriptional ArsR family regulator